LLFLLIYTSTDTNAPDNAPDNAPVDVLVKAFDKKIRFSRHQENRKKIIFFFHILQWSHNYHQGPLCG
jgi:hypothetical protein